MSIKFVSSHNSYIPLVPSPQPGAQVSIPESDPPFQAYPSSTKQELSQPSPIAKFPSSHFSVMTFILSPQIPVHISLVKFEPPTQV